MKKFLQSITLKKALGGLVVVVVVAALSLVLIPTNKTSQRITDEGDTPRGVNGKPDLMIYPRIMPAKPNTSTEVDITYSPNLGSNDSSSLVAASFTLSYPKDLVEDVTFTPTKLLERVIVNNVNTDAGTITFSAVDTDNDFKFFMPASDGLFLGKLKFKTKGEGAARFTFPNAAMGYVSQYAPEYRSTEANNLSTHAGTVYIRESGAFLDNPPTDAIPPQPESTSGTIVLFATFKDVGGRTNEGRHPIYQEFNDANNNGIHDPEEDFQGKSQGFLYTKKDPLVKDVSFKVTGPFVLIGNRFTQDLTTNQDGYAIMREATTDTSKSQVSYTLSDFVIPAGYYLSSITYPTASPLTFTQTPPSVGFSVFKNSLNGITLGISQYRKITGTVFIDADGNGTKEGDLEVGKSGVNINIRNTNSGANVNLTTDADGKYSYQIDPAANRFDFVVKVTPPANFTVNGSSEVRIASDNESHVVNFGLIPPGSPTITTAPTDGITSVPSGGVTNTPSGGVTNAPSGGVTNAPSGTGTQNTPTVTTLPVTGTSTRILASRVNPHNNTVKVVYRWSTTQGTCQSLSSTVNGPTISGNADIEPNNAFLLQRELPANGLIYICGSVINTTTNVVTYGNVLNFTIGTISPTITPTTINASPPAGGASVKISVKLPGIGTAFASDNKNPVKPTRETEIELIGQSTSTGNGTVTKATGSLNFDGSAYTGYVIIPSLTPGYYQVKVRLDNTIYKLIPGAYNLTSAAAVTTQTVTLTSGDFTRDNIVDLFDYNIILACVQEKPLCTATFRALADLNSDGATGTPDYNIFLTQLDVRNGD